MSLMRGKLLAHLAQHDQEEREQWIKDYGCQHFQIPSQSKRRNIANRQTSNRYKIDDSDEDSDDPYSCFRDENNDERDSGDERTIRTIDYM